ncbi:hypothetical protein [Kalamiella sp. sgz302252]|uniref:hypothetical protein n=1 Tax=Pantoea sp. sgz302252 TaxID=3341827 RepID=UPI0036D29F60
MFTGLSAFHLTLMNEKAIDERAFSGLIRRLVAADVASRRYGRCLRNMAACAWWPNWR